MPTEVAEKHDLLPSLDEIREAQKFIYSIMQPTPQLSWPLLNQRLGTQVWIKHENHTPIGAFKARTAIVYVAELLKREKGLRGLITATRGNHGQSVALAGQRFRIPVTIVVPFGNSIEKNAAMRAQGAKLVEFGNDFQESREHAARLADEQGLHMVQPYHRDIVKGVASYWMELFEVVPDLDTVYVPIGMGSGICAGDEDALQIIRENVERVVRVSDDEIRRAMKIYFTDTHNVVEGAGAAALAAALKEKASIADKRVGVIATGGNVDYNLFAEVLLGGEKGQSGH